MLGIPRASLRVGRHDIDCVWSQEWLFDILRQQLDKFPNGYQTVRQAAGLQSFNGCECD